MISIIVWIVTYLIIAGYFFWELCVLDRKAGFEPKRVLYGPVRCIVISALWPLALLFFGLMFIYERIVEGK